MRISGFVVFLVVFVAQVSQPALAQLTYAGLCDASAAIAIDTSHFLVGEDESDTLRLYRNDGSEQKPVAIFSFASRLHSNPDKDSDIEGAARVGDRIYWITSHGRNSKGRRRKGRHRLFATDLTGSATDLVVAWVGRYDDLVVDLLKPESWREPNAPETRRTIRLLTDATRLDKKKVKDLAPKRNGLNIEALTALPDGSGLFIGLRNPLAQGRALIIHLRNPKELLAGTASARFDQPYYLDLQGLGTRAISYSARLKQFLIVAGPPRSGGEFKLFRWSGSRKDSPVVVNELQSAKGHSPEAIVIYPQSPRVQVLNDEGEKVVGELTCKKNKQDKSFSDRWYVVE
jgi:hypothetical protein